jgi:hypothetical protein
VGGHEDEPAFGDGLRARIERARLARDVAPVAGDESNADGENADGSDVREEPGEPTD